MYKNGVRKVLFLTFLAFLSVSLNSNATGIAKSKKPQPKTEVSTSELKFSGDLRLRWQGDFQSEKDLKSVNQVRLRLAANSRINKYVSFGGRLVSGDPALVGSSGDEAISDFFTRKNISIDHAYMSYAPDPRLNFVAGKFANPFLHTELVWDDDVPFEGASQSVQLTDPNSSNSLNLSLGEFVFNKNGDEKGSYLLGFQAATKVGLAPPAALSVAAAIYEFTNEEQIYVSRKEGPLKPTIKNIKNETNRSNRDRSGYLSEFRVVDLMGKISYMVDKTPVELVVDYAQNVEAEDENKGLWATVSLGNAKAAGDVKASYNFFQIQSDAVIAAYNNFDFTATNVIGHGLVITYQPFANTFIDLIAFFRQTNSVAQGDPNPVRTRARIQASVKF